MRGHLVLDGLRLACCIYASLCPAIHCYRLLFAVELTDRKSVLDRGIHILLHYFARH